MMLNRLAFLHTSSVLVPVFARLADDLLPEVEIFHVVDESLIQNTIRADRLTKETIMRVVKHIELAHEGGADAVMVTCSSIGPSVDVARSLFDFPIYRVDEAMAETAVSMAGRIGVAATLRTTLEPTIALLERMAERTGRAVQLVPRLCEGAFAEVIAGNTDRHDHIVSRVIEQLVEEVDVVVLAQASMARVTGKLERHGTPVLSSPEPAVRRVRDSLVSPAAV